MRFVDFFVKPLEFIGKHLKALVFLLVLVLIFMPKQETILEEANLARIDLYGTILQSDTFLQELELLEENPKLKGILLVIDSPGGAIAPSIEISEAIKRLNAKIPVIVYAQGSMASGSYLAGVWADSIVANRGALLGSIGVIINGADISELADKLGIKPQTIKAGIYKEAGTLMRPWNKDEEQMLEDLVQEQYWMFVEEVANARKLDVAQEPNFGQGRILSAKGALELGLVDRVGSIYDAQILLFEKANVLEPKWLKKEKDKIEVYLEKIFGEKIALGIQNGIVKGLEQFSKVFAKGSV
ncbi:signal peptide peptidase SppA [Helicobacter sp. MIT 11-5569]|uniref:signal peptide peptidase SppA n=1 Tax=Helicobacter sp. MIT 11-5569 TaxID=1548151 RepID=UPI00051FD3F7|nr:signal peptide peptidase SppA [Helicobacter sp. MIT 11-5569]TLD85086.1 signal peptide peptidase SppA [Helicobacter sp. MIT 11-5569]